MMTMATSTVDRTTSWCSLLQSTIYTPSSTLKSTTVSKLDASDNKNQSYHNLSALRENPTRISQKTTPHDGVDAPVDDVDACNATTTTTLPPTTLDGQAAPLPYQSGLAAIQAAIDRLKQRDIANNINPNNLQHVISDTKRAELSAALAKLMTTKPAPLQPVETRPQTNPMSSAIMEDRLSDDGNRPEQPTAEPPAAPPQTINMASSNPTPSPEPTPTATQALYDFLDRYPRPINCSNDADGNHFHDESRRESSLTATLQLQTKVVRTLNVLCIELSETFDRILAAIPCNNLSPSMSNPPKALLTPSTTQLAKTNMRALRMHPFPTITQWLRCTTKPSTKATPGLKFTPYKKPIPAKPPFHSRRHMAVNRTKDCMRPP